MSDIRLNNAVIRGEIDNTRKGTILIKLQLLNVSQELKIRLSGDCLSDLAGCHLQFQHQPIEQAAPLRLDWDKMSTGEAGEITASSRLCMHRPNDSGGYHKPTLVNVLRIEFFCELGRIILESFHFNCFLLAKEWNMTEEEEFGQRASNFSAWQNHISTLFKATQVVDAQHLANLYDEIHQRFADNDHFDQDEAALMGWDGIMSALADERESSFPPIDYQNLTPLLPDEISPSQNFLTEDILEEDPWEKGSEIHPIITSVQELIEDFELQAANFSFPRGRSYQSLINVLDEIEEGLKGLLNPSIVNAMPTQTGLIGCREYLGKMMSVLHHFSKLLEVTETEDGRRELLFLRDGLLELREDISALRFQLNNL